MIPDLIVTQLVTTPQYVRPWYPPTKQETTKMYPDNPAHRDHQVYQAIVNRWLIFIVGLMSLLQVIITDSILQVGLLVLWALMVMVGWLVFLVVLDTITDLWYWLTGRPTPVR